MGQPIQQQDAHPLLSTAPSSIQQPAVTETDEWEYEYDDTATEDFYLTLDLTTHVPDALVQKKEKKPRKNFNSQRFTGRRKQPKNGSADEDESDENDEDESTATAGRLQILDLHADNPLVKFDDHVYSCHWSTDLGTQFHVAKAGEISNPRRPGTVLDIVGTTRARLLGKPADLKPRRGKRLDTIPKPAAAPVQENDDEDSDPEPDDEPQDLSSQSGWQLEVGKPLRVPRSICPTDLGQAQASFLEQLSEIKLKKGEKDQVAPFAIRIYETPSKANMDKMRKDALAADAEKKAAEKDPAEGQKRERKKRRKLTHAEKGIEQLQSAKSAGRQSRDAVAAQLGFQQDENATAGPSTSRAQYLSAMGRPILPAPGRDVTEEAQTLAAQGQTSDHVTDGTHAATGEDGQATVQTLASQEANGEGGDTQMTDTAAGGDSQDNTAGDNGNQSEG